MPAELTVSHGVIGGVVEIDLLSVVVAGVDEEAPLDYHYRQQRQKQTRKAQQKSRKVLFAGAFAV